MQKRLLALVMALTLALSLMPVTAMAADELFEVDGLYYQVVDETEKSVEVIHSSGSVDNQDNSTYSGNITVPSKISYKGTEYTVIGIGGRAFFHATGLTSITLNEGLQYIDSGTFSNSGLTSIVIPASVTRLGGYRTSSGFSSVFAASAKEPCKLENITFQEGSQLQTVENKAFEGCDSLTALEIPSGVDDLGLDATASGIDRNLGAFDGWINAKNVTFEVDSPYKNVGGVLYKGDTLVIALDDQIESVVVQEGTTSIANGAFLMCTKLESVELPEGLLTIGDNAFNYAPRVELTIPSTPGMPGGIAVEGTTPADALEYINIPSTVTSIGDNFLKGALKNDGSSVIIMQGTTPPTFGSGLFASKADSPYTVNIYYPAEAGEAYAESGLGSYIDKPGDDTTPLGYALALENRNLTVGTSAVFSVTVPSDAQLTVTSDSDQVAAVTKADDDSTITVTGVSAGSATITASITLDGLELISDTCTVTVTDSSQPEPEPTPTPTPTPTPDVPSGGSYDSEPSYSPVQNVSEGGTVKISPRTAEEGDTVTLTATPDAGYEVAEVSVTRNGREIDVTENRDGTWTYTQPRGRVTIDVTFRPVGGAAALPFRDVPETYWAYGEIAWAYENGCIGGTSATTFAPDASISRQQVWMILARLDGYQPEDMAAARAWAMANGISDGSNPGASITRQQLAAVLYRYARSQGDDTTAGGMAIREYPDYASVSAYAVEPMNWAVSAGIVTGTAQGTLNPGGTATRAQFAVMLSRFAAL